MYKYISILLLLFIPTIINAQYYYNDVVLTNNINALNKVLKTQKVSKLVVTSLDFDNEPIDNFLCEQRVEKNAKQVITTTGSPLAGETHLYSFYNNANQLIRSVDSNPTIVVQNTFTYSSNNIQNTTNISYEVGTKEKATENHNWIITNNKYEKLVVIKNTYDTITVLLICDSITTLPIQEVSYVKGKEKERYYYYYDKQNRLTDIVRYNPYKRKLLPYVTYDYTTDNSISKKTQYVNGTNDYTMWLYQYNANGLKTEEVCYLKGNIFRGKLRYAYTYD